MDIRRTLLFAALVLTAGCQPEIPTGAARWEPPAVYREWFARTQSCSGLRGDFDRIEWYVVPGRSFDCASGECAGHWQSGHTIFIAEAWVHHEMVVRHEMLHDLVGRTGHPDPPFGDPCPLTWETWASSPESRPPGKLQTID